jgi:hypothetical protein
MFGAGIGSYRQAAFANTRLVGFVFSQEDGSASGVRGGMMVAWTGVTWSCCSCCGPFVGVVVSDPGLHLWKVRCWAFTHNNQGMGAGSCLELESLFGKGIG